MRGVAGVKAGGEKEQHDCGGTKAPSIGSWQTIASKIVLNTLKHKSVLRVLKHVVRYFRPKLKNISAHITTLFVEAHTRACNRPPSI